MHAYSDIRCGIPRARSVLNVELQRVALRIMHPMAIPIPHAGEQRLRQLAATRGQQFDTIVEKAIIDYLDATAITDITTDDVGKAQMRLTEELRDIADDTFSDEAA
jgi:hypothetical protein